MKSRTLRTVTATLVVLALVGTGLIVGLGQSLHTSDLSGEQIEEIGQGLVAEVGRVVDGSRSGHVVELSGIPVGDATLGMSNQVVAQLQEVADYHVPIDGPSGTYSASGRLGTQQVLRADSSTVIVQYAVELIFVEPDGHEWRSSTPYEVTIDLTRGAVANLRIIDSEMDQWRQARLAEV